MDDFKPKQLLYAMHSYVLVVATTRNEGTWIAYCGAVTGIDHWKERIGVLADGNRVEENIARLMFSEFKDMPYAK